MQAAHKKYCLVILTAIMAVMLIFAVVFMLTSKTTAYAEDSNTDAEEINLYWGLSDGVLTLSADGANPATPEPYNTILVEEVNYPAWYNDRADITSVTVIGNAYAPQSMVNWFLGCENLTSVNLSNLNTSQVTGMGNMFYRCSSLTVLDLSGFNTASVTDMDHMFSWCINLEALDVSNFNISNVQGMSAMFDNCRSLTVLNLSNFNTASVGNMSYMFNSCSSLTVLDLSNFNTASVGNMIGIFNGCSQLNTITVSDSFAQKLYDTPDDMWHNTNLYSYPHLTWYDENGNTFTNTDKFSQGGTYSTMERLFEVTIGNTITYYDTITEAWAAARTAGTATVTMFADAEISSTLVLSSGENITLDLNGHMLKQSVDSCVILVFGTFTLEDNSDGTLPHTIINPVTNEEEIMYGGLITGGGVDYYSGGVYVGYGIFTMNGGTIAGNTSSVRGGGVYVDDGTFTMNGGAVKCNTSTSTDYPNGGGGVYVGGTFIMNGGMIAGNTSSVNGGGVLVYGMFIMNGGAITENTATDEGGGMWVGGSFKMTGGEISGNTASIGGGVYVAGEFDATFEMSGAVNITDNITTDNSDCNVALYWCDITVTGALENVDGSKKAQIGVTPLKDTGEVATGFTSANNPNNKKPSQYFIIDDNEYNSANYIHNKDYDCIYANDGTVYFGTHTGGTATCVSKAVCDNCGEEYGEVDGSNHSPASVWSVDDTNGKHYHACEYGCGTKLDEAAHVFDQEVVNETYLKSAATCIAKALYYKSCECGAHGAETFEHGELVAHTPAQAVRENEVAATCVAAGNYDEVVYCSVCNEELSRTQKTIETNDNHNWDNGAVTTDPTCTTAGVKTFTCTLNSDHTKTESVAALGHNYGEWTVVKEATETEEGEEQRVCANDNLHVESRVVPKITSSQEPKKNLTWLWILLVILLLLIIATVIYLLYRKKKKSAANPDVKSSESQATNKQEVAPTVKENETAVTVKKPEILFNPSEVRESVTAAEVDEIMSDEVAESLLETTEGVIDKTKQGIINIDTLSQVFESGETVTLDEIKKRVKGFSKTTYIKVLARGTLDKPLIVEADSFSIQAVKMIVLTGGKAISKR